MIPDVAIDTSTPILAGQTALVLATVFLFCDWLTYRMPRGNDDPE